MSTFQKKYFFEKILKQNLAAPKIGSPVRTHSSHGAKAGTAPHPY